MGKKSSSIQTMVVEDPYKIPVTKPLSAYLASQVGKGLHRYTESTVKSLYEPLDPQAYNTYQNKGLPPGPIATPSMAAVLAALNPKNTDCIFYFHDARGNFHCTENYKEHVRLLKKYYGQGK